MDIQEDGYKIGWHIGGGGGIMWHMDEAVVGRRKRMAIV